jgi:hypothetical protein
MIRELVQMREKSMRSAPKPEEILSMERAIDSDERKENTLRERSQRKAKRKSKTKTRNLGLPLHRQFHRTVESNLLSASAMASCGATEKMHWRLDVGVQDAEVRRQR